MSMQRPPAGDGGDGGDREDGDETFDAQPAGAAAGLEGGVEPGDAALLQELGRIARVVDPLPDHLVELGRALVRFRDPDAELMALVGGEGGEGTGAGAELEAVRGPAGPGTSRMHFFEVGDLSVDVEASVHDDFCTVLGVVSSASSEQSGVGGSPATEVTLETTAASFSTTADADGRFTFGQVPAGLVRLQLTTSPAGARVVTPWFEAG